MRIYIKSNCRLILLVLLCVHLSPAYGWKWDDEQQASKWLPDQDFKRAVEGYHEDVEKHNLAGINRVQSLQNIISTFKPLGMDTSYLEEELSKLLVESRLGFAHAGPMDNPYKDPYVYVVRKGDTLAEIAQRMYGNRDDSLLLYQANKGVLENPYTLYVGQKIIIPLKPSVGHPHAYHVKKGDTLEVIAQRIYGDKSKWRIIYQANKSTLRNSYTLYVGQELILPDNEEK